MTDLRPELPPLPRRMARLRIDARGYPVPWFVAWMKDGEPCHPNEPDAAPDFRVIAPGKREEAVKFQLCWVCGEKLGAHKAFVIGPMCAVNRTTAEPACHQDCADWSAIACPFLSRPGMHRREDRLPEDRQPPAGLHLDRNPGVALVWTTSSFYPFVVAAERGGGWLIRLGEPHGIRAFAEGRPALFSEVLASIESGMPALTAAAEQDGPDALRQLDEARIAALQIIASAVQT